VRMSPGRVRLAAGAFLVGASALAAVSAPMVQAAEAHQVNPMWGPLST